MTGSPDCRLFSIREIPHYVGCLQSRSKRDELKLGKTRESCVLPHIITKGSVIKFPHNVGILYVLLYKKLGKLENP